MKIRPRARISSLTIVKNVAFTKEGIPECLVKTNCGMLEGKRHVTRDGFEIDAFLGVPYAQPPVGELRFQRARKDLGREAENMSCTVPIGFYTTGCDRVGKISKVTLAPKMTAKFWLNFFGL
ncbi:hypothetical protein NECAME_12800 [Necator americanus]|uniref:Carboxylesterase type B domain-containing protein n=1 Tax=Necator americanus TaxID=51031 RepID=W2SYH6_NECAM|nr:hypothetical protein NECAME_12800 [Necator americanus]ETN74690.1 hypothetical protein NECAME_12800 [Necator americanus]